jgi:rubrerythrin
MGEQTWNMKVRGQLMIECPKCGHAQSQELGESPPTECPNCRIELSPLFSDDPEIARD